jgi:hypothetical protein
VLLGRLFCFEGTLLEAISMGHSFWRNMSELHGSVAQAIHGLARNALDDAARKANLSFVRRNSSFSQARQFE